MVHFFCNGKSYYNGWYRGIPILGNPRCIYI
jgi:hypothetical protein